MIKIPQEIINYFYSDTELKSNLNSVTNVLKGSSYQYVDPYSDAILARISEHRKVFRALSKLSSKNQRVFRKYFCDAPMDPYIRSWAHDLSSYVVAKYGRKFCQDFTNKNITKKRALIDECEQDLQCAIDEYYNVVECKY